MDKDVTNNEVLISKSVDNAGSSFFDAEREQIHRRMMSTVAHDLKTPLASIIGSLEVYTMMQKNLSPEKQAELIKVALQEAHRLDAFITDILDMEKLEAGRVKPKQEGIEIGVIIQNCLTRMESQLRGVSVVVQGPPQGIEIVTDVTLLSRAVCLLLDNAVKYGGAPPTIGIEYGDDSLGYIRIHDNGGGIAEDQIESIFSKYTRLDKGGSGLGLGLALARKIMGLLEGSITAANHPDGGTVFTVCVPLR